MAQQRGIPSQPSDPFSRAVRERLELISGERGTKLKSLESDASLSDVITKINEIIALLQG
ncbi:MAG: hypothetical protein WC733_00195 [Methylophilus sp.]|jgi:hypothetical protein